MRKGKTAAKYGILSNSLFMIREAKNKAPSVLWLVVVQALLAVAVSVLELYVSPVILKRLEMHSPLSELLQTILFFTLGIMTVSAIDAYVEINAFFGRIEVRGAVLLKIREKGCKCSYPLTEQEAFTNLREKALSVTYDNRDAAEAIWNTFQAIIKNFLGFSIYLLLLKNVNTVVVVVTALTACFGYLVSYRLNGWGYRHRQEEAAITKKILYVQDRANDRYLAKDIRIFGMESWIRELQDKYLKLYQDFCQRRERLYLLADLVDILQGFLRNGIAYFYLIHMVLNGKLGAAEFLLYFTAVSGFTAWISGIMESISTLRKQGLEIASVREFLDYEETFQMEEGEALVPDKDGSYTIELKNVTFRYPDSEKEIFSHLNLTIPPGEKLAVVGLNGAGKTTLVKLVCGFYDPDEGEVLLNGRNIKIYNRRDYYKLISGVFQDFSLMPVDVAENVAQDSEQIDMDRVRDCVEKAGLTKKIESLPQTYNTLLNREVYEEAAELSGGELQKLMLARLLYKDCPVVVLDEPTAALDAIAESDIYQRYHELTKGKSAVFISHRLASTRFCDRILLIEDGGIAEMGTHEELLAQGGRYAELFETQSQYYKEEKTGGF